MSDYVYGSDLGLTGRTVKAIAMDEENITFDTDAGLIGFVVYGDCCSRSYLFDFFGVDHLLNNGFITATEAVELSPGDPGYRPETWEVANDEDPYEDIRVYGYRFTTEHPLFGPVSSVFSFRNASNGYYGGSIKRLTEAKPFEKLHPVTGDVPDVEKLVSNVIVVQESTARKILDR